MNEKIAELKRQATIKIRSHGAFGEPESREQLDADKFAELIIRECIDICDNVQFRYGKYTFTARVVKDEIVARFGVEK